MTIYRVLIFATNKVSYVEAPDMGTAIELALGHPLGRTAETVGAFQLSPQEVADLNNCSHSERIIHAKPT